MLPTLAAFYRFRWIPRIPMFTNRRGLSDADAVVILALAAVALLAFLFVGLLAYRYANRSEPRP